MKLMKLHPGQSLAGTAGAVFQEQTLGAATIASGDPLRRAFGMASFATPGTRRLTCINAGSAECATLVEPLTVAGLRPLSKGRVNEQVSDLYSGKNRGEAAARCGSVSILRTALT